MVRSAVWWAYLPLTTMIWALVHPDAIQRSRDWLRGTPGELEVESVLAELESRGYQKVDDIKVRGRSVQRVIIGNAGIFAIQTRAWWPLLVTVRHRSTNGSWETDPHVKDLLRITVELTDRIRAVGIEEPVESLLILTRVTLPHGPVRFRRVTMIDVPTLLPFVRTRAARLSANQITMAAEAIRGGIPVAIVSTTSSQSQTEQSETDTAAATPPEAALEAPSTEERKPRQRRALSPQRLPSPRARV